jgi:hypothetical protein
MTHIEPGTLATQSRSHTIPSAAWLLLAIPLLAAALLAVVLSPRDGSSTALAAAAGDPLLAPGMIEFRNAERLSAVPAADPLTAPAAIEFRNGERLSAVPLADPLTAPAAIEFRRTERMSGGIQD